MTTLDTEHDKPSVQSHTPILDPAQRYEPIEEDTMGELQSRGETSKHSSANPSRPSLRGRRQSLVSTRTTKSYVSSLISKLSRVTTRKRTAAKPLPPIPSVPSELRNSDYRKFEESMPLPQLANRAEALSKMLAKGHNPHDNDHSSSNFYRSMPTTGVEVPWDGVAQTQDTTHQVTFYEYHPEEKVATPERPAGFWERLTKRFGKKRVIATIMMMAALLIILAVILGVLLRKKSTPVLPKCPAGRTGTDCDIGVFIFLSSFFFFFFFQIRKLSLASCKHALC